MNGFCIGYGLVALAVAVTLHGSPPENVQQSSARVFAVAAWPLMLWAISDDEFLEDASIANE